MSERLRLKNPAQQFPAGGFGFIDPRTKRVFNGMEGTGPMQAVKIIEHRRSNPTIYPVGEWQWFNQEEVIQEVYRQKHASMPELFVGYDAALRPSNPEPYRPQIASPAGLKCVCGSVTFKPNYCQTCAGSRINSWSCTVCGKQK